MCVRCPLLRKALPQLWSPRPDDGDSLPERFSTDLRMLVTACGRHSHFCQLIGAEMALRLFFKPQLYSWTCFHGGAWEGARSIHGGGNDLSVFCVCSNFRIESWQHFIYNELISFYSCLNRDCLMLFLFVLNSNLFTYYWWECCNVMVSMSLCTAFCMQTSCESLFLPLTPSMQPCRSRRAAPAPACCSWMPHSDPPWRCC